MKLLSSILILLLLASCQSPYQKGEQLYTDHCSNCHGKEGEGFRKLYPPINEDLYAIYRDEIVCIIRYGNNDTLEYKGLTYAAEMPGNDILSDIDIVNIKNFLDWKFTENKDYNSLTEVKNDLADCN